METKDKLIIVVGTVLVLVIAAFAVDAILTSIQSEEDSAKGANVTYVGNGALTEDGEDRFTSPSFSILDCPFQHPTMAFVCWNTSPTGSGFNVYPGQMASFDYYGKSLYAIWGYPLEFSISGDRSEEIQQVSMDSYNVQMLADLDALRPGESEIQVFLNTPVTIMRYDYVNDVWIGKDLYVKMDVTNGDVKTEKWDNTYVLIYYVDVKGPVTIEIIASSQPIV